MIDSSHVNTFSRLSGSLISTPPTPFSHHLNFLGNCPLMKKTGDIGNNCPLVPAVDDVLTFFGYVQGKSVGFVDRLRRRQLLWQLWNQFGVRLFLSL